MSNDRKAEESARLNPFRGQNDGVYEEDQPEMRHVKIASSQPQFAKPQAFEAKRPAWLVTPPPAIKKRSGSVTVQQEWTGEVPANWNVQPESLEMKPLDFPLERTHREITDTDVCTVANRISSVLQKLSINAEFDHEKAKCKCTSQDFVGFRIRLYSGGEGGQPVIVEVQRRTGSARSFMHSCRSILAAAEGKVYESKEKIAMPSKIGNMKCLQGVSLPKMVDPEREALDALSNVVVLLQDKRIDTNVLGLENLVCLTDPTKTSLKTATISAKSVVVGYGKFCLREEIYLVIERCTDLSMIDEDDGAMDYTERVRCLALKAFANALALTKDSLESLEKSWFKEMFVPMLLSEVDNVNESPLRASIAICCINSLPKSSMGSINIDSIRQAQAVGRERNELLAREAERCLAKFE